MRKKQLAGSAALILIVALAVGFRGYSVAQRNDAEGKSLEAAQAKEIIERLRSGIFPTPAEVDLLDKLITQMASAAPPSSAATGGVKSVAPAPSHDKRDSKAPRLDTSGFSRYPTKDGDVYTYVVDLKANTLQNFWLDKRTRPYGTIAKLKEEQRRDGNELKFAINGAIFSQHFSPQGLYIERGKLLSRLDLTKPGPNSGNFYLEPNGVFLIDSQGNARILTTEIFIQRYPDWDRAGFPIAIQSGPALLIDGKPNTNFADDSINKKRRSGVGVAGGQRVVFAISTGNINFRDFTSVFEQLGCRDALYLDGGPIGSWYVENEVEIGYDLPLVTMLGVVNKARK